MGIGTRGGCRVLPWGLCCCQALQQQVGPWHCSPGAGPAGWVIPRRLGAHYVQHTARHRSSAMVADMAHHLRLHGC